jgi:hypothetical protein
MPDSATPDYITKTDAAHLYRRSERSISRDITNALKFGDKRVLQHVELRLEDGERRLGTDLSIEEVVKLRDRGLNPTWLLETAWLKKAYGRRDEPPPAATGAPQPFVQDDDTAIDITLPDDLRSQVAVLKAQNEALKQSNNDLRLHADRMQIELTRRAEERREETELQKQSNVLLQQVYNMLSSMQETAGQVRVLPLPRTATDAQVYEPVEEQNATADRKGRRVPARSGARNARSSRSKNHTRGRQSQPAAQQEPKSESSTVSKYLPTLDRAVRSIFRR